MCVWEFTIDPKRCRKIIIHKRYQTIYGLTPLPPAGDTFAHVPPQRGVRVELGDRVPERGTLRVRIRAARSDRGGERRWPEGR